MEVAIPLKKSQSPHGSSSTSVVEHASGDGTNDYSTPATSVAVTPAGSDVNIPKKRVSATARAQALGSSSMSLNHTQRGRKRASDDLSGKAFSTESSDANLALALQREEYQHQVPKRQRVSSNAQSAWVIPDSTEDEDTLTELDGISGIDDGGSAMDLGWGEDSNSIRNAEFGERDDIYESDAEQSGSSPSTPTTEDELVSRRQRHAPANNIRNRTRPRARARDSRFSQSALNRPAWMSYRVREKILFSTTGVPLY